jgi:LytR cell envelope-related transcriptional attenuator
MTAPSPLVLLSVAAVAVAGIAFVATQGDDENDKVAVVSQPVETPTDEPTPEPEATPKKKKPAVKRGQIYVEVYNNSNVAGLAGRTATKVTEAGWQVVGSDNWRGTIPATTVYFPPRLERAAKQLGKDLGIKRLMPAVEPMRFDRLTLILTPDYSG